MTSKEKVLEFLESNKGKYISGEAVAESLELSRTAVWKAVNELRKSGYEIEAVSNKGYMLGESSDILSAAGIISFLPHEYQKAYKDEELICVYDTVGSTNRLAKELAIAGGDHGSVIIANVQTDGHGRSDHSFFSPKGGLYMSILLRPEYMDIGELKPDAVTMAVGNSVCEAIEDLTGVCPTLKPVNDLYIGDKKVCGILTEAGSEFETGLVQWIVVGIGINFDSDISSFPDEIKDIATSLFEPGKAAVSKNKLAAEIIGRIADL
ncbi:biotin--[acetyl-CoA-carboxylase] ligase [Butyrivibrio sp. X503]|uniref:biotin--[acetyl-CoA-carboxylase] ligase n=1 Tax=Butyrivibrio sp. X503 TaxID=2364878 RepID=UPI000EA96027|nr:biotin--[acetyl-CoA-carboxylase] ligase [Butyrivibrio sp. X503]RKM56629.1 biotin--[acetyl-CoA-carboxylase] ligase [Butyrivibrio sp. X503]